MYDKGVIDHIKEKKSAIALLQKYRGIKNNRIVPGENITNNSLVRCKEYLFSLAK